MYQSTQEFFDECGIVVAADRLCKTYEAYRIPEAEAP